MPQATTTSRSARVAALALLARRRLTEAQLWQKLQARGYDDEAIAAAVATCKRDGYVDDRLYAALYVEGARKPVGDARLRAELVRRGIAPDAAGAVVAAAPDDERARLNAACDRLERTHPQLSYPSLARRLERLGFPASEIYRALRERARAALAGAIDPLDDAERDDEMPRSRFTAR